MWTFAGVKPGDHLQIHDATQLDTSAITINLTLPVDATTGVAHYLMASSCNGPTEVFFVAPALLGGPPGVSMYGCNGVADILIYTADVNGALLSSFYVPNQMVYNGQVLDLTAHTYAPIANRTYTFSNHPAGNANAVFFNDTVASMLVADLTSPTPAADGNPAVVQMAMPTFPGALHVVRSDFDNDAYARHHFVDWGPYCHDVRAESRNRILPDYATGPAFDPGTQSIPWTESGSMNVPDLVSARLFTSRGSSGRYWFTHYVGPRTGTSITLPMLPTDVADYNITAIDNSTLQVLFNAKVPGGDDAVRAEVLSVLWSDDGFGTLASAGTGSLSYVGDRPPSAADVHGIEARPGDAARTKPPPATLNTLATEREPSVM